MTRVGVPALIAGIVLVRCSGAPPSTPPAPATPDPKQTEAVARADALIEDMKKRQANLQKSDAEFQRAQRGDSRAPAPAPAPARPAAKSPPATPDTTSPTPQVSRQPEHPNSVQVISSNYSVAEQGKAFWRFSWRTSIRNLQRTPIRVRVQMDFRDAKGAPISAGEQTLNINAGAVADVTGSVSTKATDGPRVASATPRIVLLK